MGFLQQGLWVLVLGEWREEEETDEKGDGRDEKCWNGWVSQEQCPGSYGDGSR